MLRYGMSSTLDALHRNAVEIRRQLEADPGNMALLHALQAIEATLRENGQCDDNLSDTS